MNVSISCALLKENGKSAVASWNDRACRYSLPIGTFNFCGGICRAKNFVRQVRRRNSEESRRKKGEEKSEGDEAEGENQSKTTRTKVEIAGRTGRVQRRQ